MKRKKEEIILPSQPNMEYEELFRKEGYLNVCGIDEAGRGPLAGPVVAAAVILPSGYKLEGLNDSKKVSIRLREKLYLALMEDTRVIKSIASSSVEEIEKFNILRATDSAMRRAAQGLVPDAHFALIDGLGVPQFCIPSQNLVKGDARSLSIAAASILAKVSRDRIMSALAKEYPDYGFERHSGYGTKAHMEAIEKYGITPHHRRSFLPVAHPTLSLEF